MKSLSQAADLRLPLRLAFRVVLARAKLRAILRSKAKFLTALRSRTDERRATEVEVAAHALNRVLELGRPSYVRIA